MKIVKLDIKGFGRFENRSFSLAPGLNVIYGLNESGKSTLQAFVKGMLFGLRGGRKTKDGALPPLRHFRPWAGKVYGGLMEYTLNDGRKYIITRNFEKNTVSVWDEYSNNITGDFPAGKEEGVRFAEQHMGLPECSFERTAFIGQMQSMVDIEGKKILAERLTNLKQTGDEEVSWRKAVKVLKDAQIMHVGSGRTTNRPLNLLETSLREAIIEEQEYIDLHENRMDFYVKLDQLQREEHSCKLELEMLLKTRAALAANQEIDMLDKMSQQLSGYRQRLLNLGAGKQRNEIKMAALQEALAAVEGYQVFTRDDVNHMTENYARVQFLGRELDEVSDKKAAIDERISQNNEWLIPYGLFEKKGVEIDEVIEEVLHQEKPRLYRNEEANRQERALLNRKNLLIAGAAITTLTVLFSILFRTDMQPFAFVGLIGLGGVLLPFLSIKLVSSCKMLNHWKKENRTKTTLGQRKAQAENQERLNRWIEEVNVEHLQGFIRLKALYEHNRQSLVELQRERSLLQEKESTLKIQLQLLNDTILCSLNQVNIQTNAKSFNEADIEIWKRHLEQYTSLLPAIKQAEGESASILQNEAGVYREISLLCGEEIKSFTELEQVIQKNTIKRAAKERMYMDSNITLDEVEWRIKTVTEKITKLQLDMNTFATRLENIPDGEMLQQAHEKVQRMLDEKDQLLFLSKALDTAAEMLSEASITIQRDYVPRLNLEMCSILSSITGGKYSNVKADDSLLLNIQPSDMTEPVLPEQLSSGTSDQVYLALRLAAVRLVEKAGESLPLFFDEPFAQYDEERTANALRLLAEESQNRQILLFTCKKREIEMIKALWGDSYSHIIELEPVSFSNPC